MLAGNNPSCSVPAREDSFACLCVRQEGLHLCDRGIPSRIRALLAGGRVSRLLTQGESRSAGSFQQAEPQRPLTPFDLAGKESPESQADQPHHVARAVDSTTSADCSFPEREREERKENRRLIEALGVAFRGPSRCVDRKVRRKIRARNHRRDGRACTSSRARPRPPASRANHGSYRPELWPYLLWLTCAGMLSRLWPSPP